jgi:hypothetical protein
MLPGPQITRSIAIMYQVCCGLQFKINDFTASHGISMREVVYEALRTHGLHPSEASYSSDVLVVSVDLPTRV